MISCYKQTSNGGVIIDTDKRSHAVCPTCSFTNTDAKCTLALKCCEGWYHKRCNPNEKSTMCTACQNDNTATLRFAIAPLTMNEFNHINNNVGVIYSSTDGSVKA